MASDKAIIRKEVSSIDFGFYTDEDVRARSICEITSPVAVDQIGTPTPGGLYDPRLGPSSANDVPCVTCCQRYLQCPGHFGHVELCVPCYHPLLFSEMLQLLRIKCYNCHRLRLPNRQQALYNTKFRLLRMGDYEKVQTLDQEIAVRMGYISTESDEGGQRTKSKAIIQHEKGLAVDEYLQEVNAEMEGRPPTTQTSPPSVYEEQYRRNLIKKVISDVKLVKGGCPHCGAFSPKIRQDQSNKIFQASLTTKARKWNLAEGVRLRPALEQNTFVPEIDDNEAQQGDQRGYDSDDNPNTNNHDRDFHDDGNILDENEDDDDRVISQKDQYMPPREVQMQIIKTWQRNPELCNEVFAVQGYKVFFLQAVAVPPNRYRPPMHLGGMTVEHTQNGYLNKILQANEMVRKNFAANNEALAYQHWIELQTQLNCFMDSSKDPSSNMNPPMGIRQLLERKEGIFRKHMMGKRVNYACRSVISPDPYIGANEIGLPRYFAETLTYPTPVTDINVAEMRELVERGPFNYPGARWVEFPDRGRVDLSKMNPHNREATAARLLTWSKKGGRPAVVGRQLRDGDMVLMNRQPTLHKPGIMAHQVRVLHNPTQKTIRMHYANCNTYNADYDGDEMNCHFPQSDLGRAEAEYIAKTDLQFIVPTDGSPLRGLIQDHVVGGVKLTKRDTFLEKWEFQQLLFAALASLPGLEMIKSSAKIELMPPAILKPKQLWTGKQVVSTLLNHLRKETDRDISGRGTLPGISTELKAKTAGAAFGENAEEHLVLIRDGELLRGVLDKAAFGATDFSLVHAVYEAYGPEKAGLLLNSLGRLFTAYIQFYSGHSCRMEDLILTKEADAVRRNLIQKAYTSGTRAAKAWADSEGGKVSIEIDESTATKPLKPVEIASTSSKVRDLLSGSEGKTNHEALDGFMMSKLNPLASDIVKACLPSGLAVPFPANTFGIMCGTGAKGSIVNQSQVSCALGQQALEGRRVPRMSSGRTLPSFAPFDVNPRADGFVMDRFLTGIRPQEYYFHCMAGREGLVDTAVKTSRSGYLQRCLVKHLEELKVNYDYTVRNGEGGVVQFLYGEDGLDPTKASYLDCSAKSFAYMAWNHTSLTQGKTSLPSSSLKVASNDSKRCKELQSASQRSFNPGDFVMARKLRLGWNWTRGSLCEGWFDATVLKKGKSPGTYDIKYIQDGKTAKNVPVEVEFPLKAGTFCSTCQILKAGVSDPVLSMTKGSKRVGCSGICVSERVAEAAVEFMSQNESVKEAMKSTMLSSKRFGSLVASKFASALADPGEAVGAIAAQSVGEPSTQMTLNTFHLAGAGANVTLGIPRLREIIMTASRKVKTPTMSVPLDTSVSEAAAVKLTRRFTKLTLNELIAAHRGICVRETLVSDGAGFWQRAYYVTLRFHKAERMKTAFGLTLEDIAQVVVQKFNGIVKKDMKRELRRSQSDFDGDVQIRGGSETFVSKKKVNSDSDDGDEEPGGGRNEAKDQDMLGDDDADDDDEDDAGEEDGVMATRKQTDSYFDDEAVEDNDAEEDEGDDDEGDAENGEGEVGVDDIQTTGYSQDSEMIVDHKTNSLHLARLMVDPSSRPLLMVGLIEKAAMKTLVRSKKNIDAAFVNHEEGRGRCLQTAGINFEELWKLNNVDHNRLMSNDVWAVRCAYGVEAARNTIVDQIRSVFGVYGIEVDPRHLSLIADYMTFGGDYTAMNRIGMREMSSPFLQMSFETTAQFLTYAALKGNSDHLQSPSANIAVGRPIRQGTGSFSLFAK